MDYTNLRLNNIFSPQNTAPMNIPLGGEQLQTPLARGIEDSFKIDNPLNPPKDFGRQNIEQSYNPTNRLEQIYQPDTRLYERYMQELEGMPQRENYKPGVLQKIGASLSALQGPQAVDQALYGRFHRDMGDWQNKVGVLEKGMGSEAKINTERLRAAQAEIQSQFREEQLALQRQKQEFDQIMGRERQELAELKNAQIYETKILDMQRKMDDSQRNLQLAYERLAQQQGSIEALNNFRNAQLEATNARHAADLALRELREARMAENDRLRREKLEKDLNESSDGTVRYSIVEDADGNYRVTTTKTGERADAALQQITVINRSTGGRAQVSQADIDEGRVGENWMKEEDYEKWRMRPQTGDIQLPAERR